MKLLRKVGATSQIFQIFIADSSSTTGAGLTGLTSASGGLTAYYHRDTDTTATAISLVTMTVGTFTSSGFKEIDATNMPGWYQFCPPNAALASGAASVGFHLKGASNMAPLPIEVDLDAQVDVTFWNGTVVATPATAGIPDVNVKNMNNVAATSITTINANQGTTQPVNFTGTGGSALAKSDTVDIAGSAVSTSSAQIGVNVVNIGGTAQTGRDIGASVLLSAGTGTGQLDFTSGVVKANLAQILGTALTETVGQIAAGFKKFFNVASPTSTMNQITLLDTVTTLTNAPSDSSGTTTLLSRLTSTRAGYLDNLNSGVPVTGDLTSTMKTSVENAVWNATLSSHLTSGSTGAALNAAGSAGDPWTTTLPGAYSAGSAGYIVGTNVDTTISSRTKPADTQAAVTTVVNLTNAPTSGDLTAAMKTSVQTAADAAVTANTLVNAIKTKTDNIPASPAAVGSAMTLTIAYDAAKTASQAGDAMTLTSGERTTFTAAIWAALTSGLTTTGSIGKLLATNIDATISSRFAGGSYTAPDNTSITAIKAKTDNLPASPAATGDIPTGVQNADALLDRDMATGTDSGGRTVRNALRTLRNKVDTTTHSGEVTVFKENDTTEAWRAPLTTDAAALPITGIDPA